MKILLIDRFLGGHDGPGIYLYELCTQLLSFGHQVLFAYGKLVGDHIPKGLESIAIDGLHPERYGTSEGRLALARVLRSFQPDVAGAHCLDVYWFAEDVSKHCPLVLTLHTHAATCPNWTRLHSKTQELCTRDFGPACVWHNYASGCGSANPKQLAESMLRVAANRASFPYADAFHATTPYMRQTLENAGVPPGKIFDSTYFAPFFDASRRYTPPRNDPPRILFVGRLHPSKGPDLLLQAFAQLSQHVVIDIMGGGPMADALEVQVNDLGLADRCFFYITDVEEKNAKPTSHKKRIRREEMPQLFLDASMVVFPSIWGEPSGIVRLETMVHGRPLIGFDAGGTAHCIEHGVTGFVVPRLDVQTLALRMSQLLDNPALAERMGRAALASVVHDYHPVRIAREIEAAYARTIAARRGDA